MKPWIKIALWSLFALGIIALMFTISSIQSRRVLEEPTIIVVNSGKDPFITDVEFLSMLKREGFYSVGMTRENLKIEAIEAYISAFSQVKTVKVFTEIGTAWKVEVQLRKPIARIFNSSKQSFYIDDEGEIVSVTPSHTAQVLVVSGQIRDREDGPSVNVIINNDSLKSILKLDDIYRISNYVCYDPFFRSMIGQLYLESNGDFVLIPLVGDQKIVFGTAETEQEVEEKFSKLRIFYEEAMPYVGWDTYSEISLKYDGQIVSKKKPVAD